MSVSSAPRSPSAGPGRRLARTEQMTGEQLRIWMEDHHYTAVGLGLELGVTARTVFRWRTAATLAPLYLTLALETLHERHRRRKGTP